jgi:hypothetical protein
MKEIKADDWMPWQAMEVVTELRQKGYVMGIDFDWEYHKPEYDVGNYGMLYNRYTLFIFYKEELATWFSLTYL